MARNVHSLITTSLRLQFRLRQAYHGVASHRSLQQMIPLADRLKRLLDTEERVRSLAPTSTSSVEISAPAHVEVDGDYMLVGEEVDLGFRSGRAPYLQSPPPRTMGGWSLWDLAGSRDALDGSKSNGGQSGPQLLWREQSEETILAITMSRKDNLLAVMTPR